MTAPSTCAADPASKHDEATSASRRPRGSGSVYSRLSAHRPKIDSPSCGQFETDIGENIDPGVEPRFLLSAVFGGIDCDLGFALLARPAHGPQFSQLEFNFAEIRG